MSVAGALSAAFFVLVFVLLWRDDNAAGPLLGAAHRTELWIVRRHARRRHRVVHRQHDLSPPPGRRHRARVQADPDRVTAILGRQIHDRGGRDSSPRRPRRHDGPRGRLDRDSHALRRGAGGDGRRRSARARTSTSSCDRATATGCGRCSRPAGTSSIATCSWPWRDSASRSTTPSIDLELDVFVERLEFCHTIELDGRWERHATTIPIEDLLLQKLQVHELTDSDVIDAAVVLATHDVGAAGDPERIDRDYVAGVLAGDWGFHRDATANLDRVRAAAGHACRSRRRARVASTTGVAALQRRHRAGRKSMAWRMRARVGRADAVVGGRQRAGGHVLMRLRRAREPAPATARRPCTSPPTCTARRSASASSSRPRPSTAPICWSSAAT